MTIAMDADDMGAVRNRLRDAAERVGDAVPRLPGPAAFGPAVLAGAVVSFESELRRQAFALRDRWLDLEAGVGRTFEEMSVVEAQNIAELEGLQRYVE